MLNLEGMPCLHAVRPCHVVITWARIDRTAPFEQTRVSYETQPLPSSITRAVTVGAGVGIERSDTRSKAIMPDLVFNIQHASADVTTAGMPASAKFIILESRLSAN